MARTSVVTDDTLITPSGGGRTAEVVPGARLELIEGMGHDLPPGVWTKIADGIERTVRRGESALSD